MATPPRSPFSNFDPIHTNRPTSTSSQPTANTPVASPPAASLPTASLPTARPPASQPTTPARRKSRARPPALPPNPTAPAHESHYVLILRVAIAMPETFTKTDLVVAAWKQHPREFGLRTYDLPNAQAVYCKIDGATGLVGRGYLEWVSAGVLRVTAAGRSFAAKPVATEPRATYAELRTALVKAIAALEHICVSLPRGDIPPHSAVTAIEMARDALRRSR